jgi:hypothetical protein
MDVEDLVVPEADDIAGTCAEILSDEGVPVTFCIVGEKVRLLEQRGRGDVTAALGKHDIGLHTDFHSVHPTIAEAMAVRDWEEGATEAVRREQPGVEAIERVFGTQPSCWGGPGNTWGPQVCEAVRRMGIPAFVYAHTCVPEGGIHRFAGCIAYPNGPGLSDGLYHDDAAAERQRDQLEQRLRTDAAAGVFWHHVFLGHPTRILHEEFWDAPNFAGGANPPREQWKPARRKSQANLDRALVNFRKAARMLRSLPEIELQTVRQMNARLESASTSPLTPEEQAHVWPEIEANLVGMKGWPIMPPDFDVSNLLALTHAHLNTLERFDHQEAVL